MRWAFSSRPDDSCCAETVGDVACVPIAEAALVVVKVPTPMTSARLAKKLVRVDTRWERNLAVLIALPP